VSSFSLAGHRVLTADHVGNHARAPRAGAMPERALAARGRRPLMGWPDATWVVQGHSVCAVWPGRPHCVSWAARPVLAHAPEFGLNPFHFQNCLN
jgi:hypothetical protein